MNKKAQITIFIIIGILIVLSVVVVYFIRSRAVEKPEAIAETKPAEFEKQPFQVFIEDCIGTTATDALNLIGLQGGYINLTDPEMSGTGFELNSFDPTSSEALPFDESWYVAYWYYLKSRNAVSSYRFATKRPPMKREQGQNSIESQLDKYITRNLNLCLNDFDAFKKQGYEVTKQGNIKTTSTITSESVVINVDYPLKFKKLDREFVIKEARKELNVDFKGIYELANLLTSMEINSSFMEQATLNWISVFSGLDSNALPPFGAFDPQFGNRIIWMKSNVEQNVQDLITTYVPTLNYYGSLNYQRVGFENNLTQSLYDFSILPTNLVDEDYSFNNYVVEFTYLPMWDIYFDIEGRGVQGEIIGPEELSMAPYIMLIELHRYNNYYDVSFPVLVELYDPYALDNNGYKFMFAMEVNVRDNLPINATGPEEFAVSNSNLLCNYNQRNTGEITIETIDKKTQEPLEDVMIYYACGDQTCIIDKTKLESNKAGLKTKLPLCLNGAAYGSKDGYWSRPEPLSTFLNKPDYKTLELEPYRTVKAKVMKKSYMPETTGSGNNIQITDWNFDNTARNLDEEAQAIVTLERIKEASYDPDFMTAFEYRDTQEPVELKLIPGKYNVEITLILHKRVAIHNKTEDKGGWMSIGEEEVFYDEVIFDKFLFGGAYLSEEYNILPLGILPEQLDNNELITFYAIAAPDGFTIYPNGFSNLRHEDIEMIGKVEEYSTEHRTQIEPSFG